MRTAMITKQIRHASAGCLGSKHSRCSSAFQICEGTVVLQIDLYIEIQLSMLKDVCSQEVRDASAEAYMRGRGGVSSLSADFKFASSDLTDNLNNFKQASVGNHWFTEQTETPLQVKTGPLGPKEIQFLSSMGIEEVVVVGL